MDFLLEIEIPLFFFFLIFFWIFFYQINFYEQKTLSYKKKNDQTNKIPPNYLDDKFVSLNKENYRLVSIEKFVNGVSMRH